MQTNTFLRHGVRLLMAVVMLVMLAPSTVMAAEVWSYPQKGITTSSTFGGGSGTKNDPYIISTAQHLANLAFKVSWTDEDYDGKYFLQTRDIVLNDDVIAGATKEADGSIRYSKNQKHFDSLEPWQPIGMYGSWFDSDFEGIYDGGGHSISGIYCRKPVEKSEKAYHYIGLFGSCDEARISNLTIKDSFFSICALDNDDHSVSLGTLVGVAKSTILTNCHTENCVISGDGDIKVRSWNIGGLVGKVEGNFTGYGCSYDGVVDAYHATTTKAMLKSGEYYIGGLVGATPNDVFKKDLTLSDCTTSGKLLLHEANETSFKNGSAYVGGLVGRTYGSASNNSISRCTNRMDISVYADDMPFPKHSYIYVSGISCGNNECSECVNFGNIDLGGKSSKEPYRSALIYITGICSGGNADNCFNYGDINVAPMPTSNDKHIGPWIAMEGEASNCFAYNTVTYKFDEGTTSLYLSNTGDDVTINNAHYYITVNGEAKNNGINKADFTSKDYAQKLNDAAGASKYGLINEDGFHFDGHLSLTSLGALANGLYGYGTEDKPYIIANASDLRSLVYMFTTDNDFEGKLFKLTANIDMTNEPGFAAIGSTNHPFNGIFDGGGHYIRGLKATNGYLFDRVTGTVKNLALDGLHSQDDHLFAGIAYNLGAKDANSGRIENCYVIGNPTLKVNNGNIETNVGGICHKLWNGASIADCYFTGNVTIVNDKKQDYTNENINVGGIATTAETGASIERCYAVMDYDVDAAIVPLNESLLGGIVAEEDEGKPTLSNNYYHIDIAATSQQPTAYREYDGTTSANEYGIRAKDLGDAWMQGWYYPVLKSAFHYDCKDSNSNAVVMDPADYAPKSNEILTIVPTDGQQADTKMWQLANVAVYSADLDAEILTNFSIIPDTETDNYPLRYKPTREGVSVKGLANYPWAVKQNAVNWRGFCLPGEVSLANLPDGCKLYVGGKLVSDAEGSNKMNIVEVETVPAGVPFLLRYDNKTDDVVNITMTGDLVMTPQKADESSSLEGTFQDLGGVYGYYTAYEETTDGETKTYMSTTSRGYDSFSAYVKRNNSTSKIELVDYLLLDEQSNETDDIIAANKGNKLNIKLRRSIKAGGWNTLCLPFDVSSDEIASALGSGTRIEELKSIDYDAESGSVVMKFGAVQEIEAGKPYLVRPEKAGDIFDLGQRTIVGKTEDGKADDGTMLDNAFNVTLADGTVASISMIGSYGKTALLSTDTESQYFIQQDKFYRVVDDPVISLGYRCWFKVADMSGKTSQALNAARIIHADGTVTDIKLIDTGLGTDGTRIYDIQGIQHDEMQRGLNIVGGKKIVKH